MSLKKNLLLLFVIISGYLFSQTTYTVTSVSLNGGLNISLDDNIRQAIIDANAGQNVVILFNAPGLVQIDEDLPPITINSGKITFLKHPGATVAQGLLYSSGISDGNISSGLLITNCLNNSEVIVKNLNIVNFLRVNSPQGARAAIRVTNANKVSVDGCFFKENQLTIFYDRVAEINIINNSFQDGNQEILHQGAFSNDFINTDNIKNNTFNFTGTAVDQSGGSIVIASTAIAIVSGYYPSNISANIENNVINDYVSGIQIEYSPNPVYYPLTDISYQVSVHDNVVTNNPTRLINGTNLSFGRPFKHFKVFNNTLTHSSGINIGIGGDPALPNPFGLDFINTNPFSIQPNNSGNILNGVDYVAPFFIGGNLGEGVNIIGHNLHGRIGVMAGKYSILRGNQIQCNQGIPNKPHHFFSSPNGGIEKPILNDASVLTNLNVSYNLSSALSSLNESYVVDFYKSNANGDMLDYIGYQNISSLTNSTYTCNIPVPNGVTLNLGDRIAVTVTSLGDHVNPAAPLGTSEISYITLTTPPCAASLSLTCTASGYSDDVNGVKQVCINEPITFNINTGISSGPMPTITINYADGTSDTQQGYTASFSKQYPTPSTPAVTVSVSGSTCTTVTQTMVFEAFDCCCKLTDIEIKDNNSLPIYTGTPANLPNITIAPTHTLSILSGGNQEKCNFPNNFSYTSGITWSWGDGSAMANWDPDGISHPYNTLGNYTLSYNYTSNYPGCAVETYTSNVFVAPCCTPPIYEYANGLDYCAQGMALVGQGIPGFPIRDLIGGLSSIRATSCVGRVISFNMSNYDCPTGVLTYNWDFGDGTILAGNTVSHSYATAGTYTLSVTYSNGSASNCSSDLSFIITVESDCCPTVTDTHISAFDPYSIDTKTVLCSGNNINFFLQKTGECLFDSQLENTQWSFSDGYTASGFEANHIFNAPGTYTITATVNLPGCSTYTYTLSLVLEDCEEITCADCIGSFAPEPGKYVFSMWVREDVAATVTSYSSLISGKVETTCSICSSSIQTTSFSPQQGTLIIDGWQKVEGTFTVPTGAEYLTVSLDNGTGNDVYFDDIRIHPFNSSSKTYVYDPVTLRLSAELDENNYATFYEYDEEGALVRVKKETEKGIKTIKEARNNIQKK